jgi:hypothetical protein
VDAHEFAIRYPTLYHMADEVAWPSIQKHGLLSTRAMVDLYDPEPAIRAAILCGVRRSCITLESDELGTMTVRDQLPLKFLDACLEEGATRQDFLDALNGRVFFWLSMERLQRLLSARAYKNRRHIVMHVDTAALLKAYGAEAELAPINTGSAHVPNVPKRGPDVFVALERYQFEEWHQKRTRSGEPVVELTLPYAVPGIANVVRRVELRQANDPPTTVFEA